VSKRVSKKPSQTAKARGEISQAKVIARLLELGYPVASVFGDNNPADQVISRAGNWDSVQVKTGWLENGCVRFSTCSVKFTKKRQHYRRNYLGRVKFFIVYCPEIDRYYQVPVEEAPATRMLLRLGDRRGPRGGPPSNWAGDYELKERLIEMDVAA
jgi:hypothetical protein